MRYIILLFSVALLCPACKSYTADKLPAEYLRFGSKGGFSGGERTYFVLLDGGRVLFEDEFSDGLESVGKLTRAEFNDVKARLGGVDFTRPGPAGNYTTSLTYHSGNDTHTLRWAAPGGAPTEEANQLYNTLMDAVRRLRGTSR